MIARLLPLLATIFLVACGLSASEEPVPATPALYRIDGGDGGQHPAGWLFGTIHALPPGTEWRGDIIDNAMSRSGLLVVEVRELNDQAALRKAFAKLSKTQGLPPLPDRVAPDRRADIVDAMEEAGFAPGDFRDTESWAAALTLSSALAAKGGLSSESGTDRALIRAFADRNIVGLETASGQLSIFDRLREEDQVALVESLLDDADKAPEQDLAKAWMRGDVDRLVALTDEGLAASAGLRMALLTQRNEAWVEKIEPMLQSGQRPFVAVGAGHIGGADGLAALLRARGWSVERVQ